ncbi:MAG: hypothetical protein Fur0010_14860 [Bdellovibrio sp.]
MVGFEAVSHQVHELEDFLKKLENNNTLKDDEIEIFLKGIDSVRGELTGEKRNTDETSSELNNQGHVESPGTESHHTHQEQQIEATMLNKARILVVDDEPGALKLVKMMIGPDYHVETVPSAEEALNVLKSQLFQVILTDVKMPKISGLELLRLVRKDYADIPVIIMTGHADKNLVIESINDGAFYFLEKPFDKKVLQSAIRKAMYQRAKNYLAKSRR